MNDKAYHGGAFFDAVGHDFTTLEKSESVIKADVLDAWFEPSPTAISKIKEYLPYILQTSPPTHAEGLIETISKTRNIPEQNIAVNGGSSDIIFNVLPTLLSSSDTAMILDPMYGEYQHVLENVVGCSVGRFKLHEADNFMINVENLIEQAQAIKPKVLVIVNPNSPTGAHISKESMLRIVDALPKETTLIVDEAYIEYVESLESLESDAAGRANVIVIKTMSKVYGLSGARVAYVVANEKLIQVIKRKTPPWAVGLIGQIAAVEALKDDKYYAQKYSETHELRVQMVRALSHIKSVKVFDGVANFVLIKLLGKHMSAQAIVDHLRKESIFVRNCDSMGQDMGDKFIRVSVVKPEHVDILITNLVKFLESYA